MTSIITAEIRPNKFTTRKGYTRYGVRITVRADGALTDIVEFEYDRSSLTSFVEARQWAEWFKRGIDIGACRAAMEDGALTDIVEFEYDRSSLTSFVEARQWAEWFKRGIDIGACRAAMEDEK